jgi:hypothetical protein
LYTGDLASLGIFAPRRPYVNLRGQLQSFSFIKHAEPVEEACYRNLSVWREGDSRDKVRELG